MSDDNCPLCEHADREAIEDAIGKGITPKSAIANQLGMDTGQIYEHMKNHLKGATVKARTREIQSGLDEMYNKYDMLFNNVVGLNDILGPIIEKGLAEPDTIQIQRITRLAAEIRQGINDLARLKGEIASESKITIIQYNQLKAVVMGELCTNCKGRVKDALEDETFTKKIEEMIRV